MNIKKTSFELVGGPNCGESVSVPVTQLASGSGIRIPQHDQVNWKRIAPNAEVGGHMPMAVYRPAGDGKAVFEAVK